MKSFKKALVMLLVLALVLGTMATGFAAAPSDVTGTKYEAAVDNLIKLGVVNGYPDGTYKPGNIVTRAEMAKLVVVAMGLKDAADAVKANTIFSDVKADHWASGYINVAVNLGILKGYPDGTFKPENTVTYAEAVTMLLRALGYKDDKLAGNWPTNFIVKAASLGVTSGVTMAPNNGAVRGDIAVLVYNTLKTEMVKYDTNGNEQPDKILLTKLATEKTYTILATADVDSSVDAGTVSVLDDKGNPATVDTAIDLNAYLGKKVEVFVNNDDEIIAVDKVDTTDVKTYTLTDEATWDVTGSVYKLTDDNLSLTANIKADATVVINGVKTTLNATVAGKSASKPVYQVIGQNAVVTLINNDNDKYYDYIVVDKAAIASDYYIVKNDVKSTTTYIDGVSALEVKDSDGNYYKVFGAVNKATDIKKGDVIYYMTIGNSDPVIYVVRNTVTGKVTKVTDDNTFTINGKEYDRFSSSIDISAGDEGTATLDKDGKIVKWDVTETTTTDNYALVLDVGSFGTGINDNNKIKLAKTDGTEAVYEVVYDDVDHNELAKLNPFNTNNYDIIKYTLNKDGKIDSLEVISSSATTDTVYDNNVSDNSTIRMTNATGKVYQVTSDTVVFNIDTTNKEISIINATDIPTNSVSYTLDGTGKKLQYVFVKDATITQDNMPLVYVDSTSKVTLENGDKYIEYTVIENGVQKVYQSKLNYSTSDNVANIVADKVYQFKLDKDGKVIDIQVFGNDKDYTETTNLTLSSGSLDSLDDNIIKIGNTSYVLDNNVVVIDATKTSDVKVVSVDSLTETAKIDLYVDNASDRVVLIVVHSYK